MTDDAPRKKQKRKRATRRSKTTKAVSDLLDVVTGANLNNKQLIDVVADFLYSLGNAMEQYPKIKTSEELLERYGNKPTIGNSLMAQAKLMKEAWTQDIIYEETKDTHGDIQRTETTE